MNAYSYGGGERLVDKRLVSAWLADTISETLTRKSKLRILTAGGEVSRSSTNLGLERRGHRKDLVL